MNGARSFVEKADEDFFLDENEMTNGEEQKQSMPTTKELMDIIQQLRVENVALAKANSELRRQSQHPIYAHKNVPKSPTDEHQNYHLMLEIMRKEAQELKEIRDLAEARTQSTISYITQLEQQVGDLSLQLIHKKKADEELLIIKRRLRKLETLALEYVPLGMEAILAEIDECKTAMIMFQKRQKQRLKKEELTRKEKW